MIEMFTSKVIFLNFSAHLSNILVNLISILQTNTIFLIHIMDGYHQIDRKSLNSIIHLHQSTL